MKWQRCCDSKRGDHTAGAVLVVAVLLVVGLIFAVLGFGYGIVMALLREFVVPVMYARRCSLSEGWAATRSLVPTGEVDSRMTRSPPLTTGAIVREASST